MSDLVSRPRAARRLQGSGLPAAASATATCSAPAAAGRPRCSNAKRCARCSRRFFADPDSFSPGRVQRLPDAERSCKATSSPARSTGRDSCATAASSSNRGWGCSRWLIPRRCSCAGWRVRGSRWRSPTARVVPGSMTGIDHDATSVALRYVAGDGAAATALSGQPERIRGRHRRPVQHRRPRHHPDAASRTCPCAPPTSAGPRATGPKMAPG
jgi:hypothetical protein